MLPVRSVLHSPRTVVEKATYAAECIFLGRYLTRLCMVESQEPRGPSLTSTRIVAACMTATLRSGSVVIPSGSRLSWCRRSIMFLLIVWGMYQYSVHTHKLAAGWLPRLAPTCSLTTALVRLDVAYNSRVGPILISRIRLDVYIVMVEDEGIKLKVSLPYPGPQGIRVCKNGGQLLLHLSHPKREHSRVHRRHRISKSNWSEQCILLVPMMCVLEFQILSLQQFRRFHFVRPDIT